MEEGIQNYNIGGFHPVRLGEVYGNKYKIFKKLGYGRYSTVWLVRHEQDNSYWAMKILSAECYGAENDVYELEILQRFEKTNPQHIGASYISRLIDSFEHQGPNGRHTCLVFKIMGESLLTFMKWFPDHTIPGPLLQRFTTQLLQALDYASVCEVIHTDIQPSNIMIQIPDERSVIDYLNTLYSTGPAVPPPQNATKDYVVIQSQGLRDIYFPEGFNLMTLDLALSDWGVASFAKKHLSEVIQPILLRAPEVILEAPWGTAVEVWNLGALVPELLYQQKTFSARDSAGAYSTQAHVEEITALLGPFPARLLAQARLKNTGELFNVEGNIQEPRLQKTVSLAQRFSDLPMNEAPKFEALVRAMLTIDPEKRKTAKQLLEEPWLKHEYTEDLSFE